MSHIIIAPGTSQRSSQRAILRLSGRGCHDLVLSSCSVKEDQGRLKICRFKAPFSNLPVSVYLFKEGYSYSTEEMVELHFVGNTFLSSDIKNFFISQGARQAEAGEFTRLAVKGGRLSLSQALAVMHLITSKSREEHKRALNSLCHRQRDTLEELQQTIHRALIQIENELDFDDLDEGLLPNNFFEELLEKVSASWVSLRRSGDRKFLPKVLLWGKANAGKSTLFNVLGGGALTSSEAGTTRDWLSVDVSIKGCHFELVDTPGYDGPDKSYDITAKRLAKEQQKAADLQLTIGRLKDREQGIDWYSCADKVEGSWPDNAFSSLTGQGLEKLKDWIWERLIQSQPLHFFDEEHCQKIDEAFYYLQEDVNAGLLQDAVVWSSHLREFARLFSPLGEKLHPDEVLNDLFANFCIGK